MPTSVQLYVCVFNCSMQILSVNSPTHQKHTRQSVTLLIENQLFHVFFKLLWLWRLNNILSVLHVFYFKMHFFLPATWNQEWATCKEAGTYQGGDASQSRQIRPRSCCWWVYGLIFDSSFWLPWNLQRPQGSGCLAKDKCLFLFFSLWTGRRDLKWNKKWKQPHQKIPFQCFALMVHLRSWLNVKYPVVTLAFGGTCLSINSACD